MSDKFLKFSPAARLYAQYAAVVEEMLDTFESDISAFLDALRDMVKSHLRSGTFQEEGTKTRSWWLEDDDLSEDDEVPYLWFNPQDPQIVTPGILSFEVHADGDLRPYQPQLAKMLSELQLPNCSKAPASGGWGHMFTVTVSFKDNADPVGIAAEPIATLLATLYEAEQKWRKILRKDRTSKKRK